MPEIDIDKMLEEREKKEEVKLKKKKTQNLALYIAVISVVLAAAVGVFIVIGGENASDYFPFDSGKIVNVNLSGGSPEQWHFLEKPENYAGYECYVFNKTDLSNNTSVQEYYTETEEGITLLAVSDNFGNKIKNIMVMLPSKLKAGKKFKSAETVNGLVVGFEKSSEGRTVRIDYKGEGVDLSAWYAKGIGLIKTEDRISGKIYGLISVQQETR